MADDDVSGLADGETAAAELARTLDGVRRTARGIASDLGNGLASAVVHGERLDQVLARAAERLTGRLLDRALVPLEGIVAGGLSTLASTAAATMAPIDAARSAATLAPIATAGPAATTAPIATAGAVRSAGDAATAGAAEAVGRPAATSAGERPVQVTLYVTTPDAEGFRRSEAHVSAMLARAVRRGRRGM